MVALLARPHASSRAGESAAAALAAQAPTDADQCELLRRLCHAAVLAGARASDTPRTSRTDTLMVSQEGKAALAARDARDAARVIERRHDGRRLPCFDEPECRFLGPSAASAPAKRRTR